jgi:diacylglycerol kinase family enzyme
VRVVFLVNTTASSVTARTRVVIQKALSAGNTVTVAETSRRGHAMRLAQGAAADGADLVVVLGGDGTLNEAANGLAGTDTALGVLPGGSTNVFARTIGMTNDPVEATGELLDGLTKGRLHKISLGSVNGRYFLFHVGMGFDAAVVEQVERRGGLKRYLGHPLFVYAAFSTWFRHYDFSRPRMSVAFPDGDVVDDSYLTIVLNSNPYTFLGPRPLDLAPDADLSSGLVSVTLRTLGFAPLLGIVGAALRGGGRLRDHKGVDYRARLTGLTVRGHGPFPYQVDGDHLGSVESLEFRHHPDALTVVYPGSP